MNEITLTKPDDFHVHLRDLEHLYTTVPHTAARFARALIMPNLSPPVVDAEHARNYQQRILANVPNSVNFTPLMSLYLTDNTTPKHIQDAAKSGIVFACKLYPAGATTNSDSGVTNLDNISETLGMMQTIGMPLLIHGEVTSPEVDIFDRERVFIETILQPLVSTFPNLRIVLEHITTKDAVDFVMAQPEHIAATITAHHLLINRNDMLVGGIKPHHYCLPVAKRNTHQKALIQAATSGSLKFFLGTDSAPHTQSNKESSCGCAGIYTAHAAIELYAHVFDQAGKLDKLENFASHFGADFYQLPRNTDTLTLKKSSWTIPEHYLFGGEPLIPFWAQHTINWQITP